MRPENIVNQRILLSPLNWGMGHVARCIGLIHQLQNQGNELFIACEEAQKVVFEEYFEGITFISHSGYPFYFGGKGHFGLDLLRRMKSLSKRMKQERVEVEKMVDDHTIDYVISDHRYGFQSKRAHSIFMTHQVNLPLKWYEKSVGKIHRKLMLKFDHIWILDDESSSLAGKLSENCPKNGMYIGHYSRFSLYEQLASKSDEIVLIASGPDVYARLLIENVLAENRDVNKLIVMHAPSLKLSLEVSANSGDWKEKDALIRSASHIISHSGYSTLMDCKVLGISATFYPTKGQTEQEYLAKRWMDTST